MLETGDWERRDRDWFFSQVNISLIFYFVLPTWRIKGGSVLLCWVSFSSGRTESFLRELGWEGAGRAVSPIPHTTHDWHQHQMQVHHPIEGGHGDDEYGLLCPSPLVLLEGKSENLNSCPFRRTRSGCSLPDGVVCLHIEGNSFIPWLAACALAHMH